MMMVSTDKLADLSDVQRNKLESMLFDFDQSWTAESIGRGYQTLRKEGLEYRQAALVFRHSLILG